MLLVEFYSVHSHDSSGFSTGFLGLKSPLYSPGLGQDVFSASAVFFSHTFSSSEATSVASTSAAGSSDKMPVSVISVLQYVVSVILTPDGIRVELPPLAKHAL